MSPVSVQADSLVVWTAIYAVAAVATFLVLGLASGLAVWQIREVSKSRHAALLADLSRRWDESLLTESRRVTGLLGLGLRERMEVADAQNTEELYVLQRIPNYFEDLGVLEEVGAISFEMVRRSLGRTIVDTWDHWEPTVAFLRRRYGDDEIYFHFQNLAEKMREALGEEEVPATD